jgi:response regulator of citrate/malate metabolism
MTKSQVRRYIKNLEEKRKLAQKKLDEAKKSKDWQKEKKDLINLENLINQL